MLFRSLVQALSDLVTQRDEGKLDFDRVVIETTGVANPGPVAQTFFMDEEIASRYLLDAVITLVDAKHGNIQLDKQEEAQRQVGFADTIFITKADLVTPAEVDDLRHRLQHMNARAPIRVAADVKGGPSVAIADYQSEADEDAGANDREETKRLLYVALTRARDRLYLSGAVANGA